jgi:hypothetical protein
MEKTGLIFQEEQALLPPKSVAQGAFGWFARLVAENGLTVADLSDSRIRVENPVNEHLTQTLAVRLHNGDWYWHWVWPEAGGEPTYEPMVPLEDAVAAAKRTVNVLMLAPSLT